MFIHKLACRLPVSNLLSVAITVVMAELEAADQGNWGRTVKDLAAGAAGGIAQVLLGMSDIFLSSVLVFLFSLSIYFSRMGSDTTIKEILDWYMYETCW